MRPARAPLVHVGERLADIDHLLIRRTGVLTIYTKTPEAKRITVYSKVINADAGPTTTWGAAWPRGGPLGCARGRN